MKADNEILLRALDKEAAGVRRDRRGCPPVALAVRLLTGDAAEAERLAFADHLLGCPDCAAEFRLATPLEDLARRARPRTKLNEERSTGKPRIRSSFWLTWAAAAAVLAALGLSVTWLASRRQPEVAAIERGAAAPTSAVVPPDGSVLAEPPTALSWTPVQAAESYRVVLFDSESTPFWEEPSRREARAPLPDAVRDRLRRGGDFYWRVETRRRGERLSSDLHRFSLPVAARRGG